MNKPDFQISKARLKKTFFKTTYFRRIVQLGILGFIVFLLVQQYLYGENGPTSVPSAEAFCPFGGLESLYSYLSTGTAFLSHTHLSNLVMLIAVMIVALVFRSAFCGWICPLGFLQDMIAGISKWLQKHITVFGKFIRKLQKFSSKISFLDRYLRLVKYFVLIWTIGGAIAYGFLVFRDFDPWAAFLNILEFSWAPGMVVLLVVFFASFFIERPWCRYACPLGAISGIVGKISPSAIHRNESSCTNCRLCSKACPMGISVHTVKNVTSLDCNSCLECIAVCPQKGTLEVKVGLPFTRK